MKRLLKIFGYTILALVAFFVVLELFQAPRFEAVVSVIEGENKIGVTPTTERLDFGDLSRGATAVRFIDLQNESQFKTAMYVLKFGELGELIDVNNGSPVLSPDEKKRIEFSLYIPNSAETRIYKAKIWIIRVPRLF